MGYCLGYITSKSSFREERWTMLIIELYEKLDKLVQEQDVHNFDVLIYGEGESRHVVGVSVNGAGNYLSIHDDTYPIETISEDIDL